MQRNVEYDNYQTKQQKINVIKRGYFFSLKYLKCSEVLECSVLKVDEISTST